MKPFEIKDLLDPEKLKKLKKETAFLEQQKTLKREQDMLKKIDKQDNLSRVNQWGQEGKILDEWGVEPED